MDEIILRGFQVSVVAGHSQPLPTWWAQIWAFSKTIPLSTSHLQDRQRIYIFSVPQMHGALSAVSLGLLDGLLSRLLASAKPKEIALENVRPGMLVQIESGQSGSEVFFGEVGLVDSSSEFTIIQVGHRRFSSRFIQKIQVLSKELGKPEGHYSKSDLTANSTSKIFHSFDPMRHLQSPVLRPFLVLRTVPEHSKELDWVIHDPKSGLNRSVEELLHGMQKGDKESVATLVANTKESLMSKMQELKVDSSGLLDSEEVTCLIGTKAILENLENSDSKTVVCVLARDEDSIANAQSLITQIYAYAEKLECDIPSSGLPESFELAAFDRGRL